MEMRSGLKLLFGKSGVVFILCFFSHFLALGNSQLFSINPTVYEERFDIDDTDIRLFLLYPTITCLFFLWPVLKAVKDRNLEIRFWLLVFNWFNATGSSLRLIPLFYKDTTWIFHVAELLIPVGVLSNALAAQMAVIWFPPEYRGLTSSFVVVGGVLGASFLKTFGAMVTTSTSDAPIMFYVEAIAAVTLFLAVLLFCPTKPGKLSVETEQGKYKELESKVIIYWGKGVSLTIASIALLRGIKAPMFANMTALLTYDGIDNSDAAYISSVQGFTPVVGAAVLGGVMSFNKIRAQRRLFLILSMFIYGCIGALFSLSFNSYFWPQAPLPFVYWHSMVIQAFAGAVWGFMRSLTHEYIAELSYPTPPVYFGLWMELGKNFIAFCVLLIPSRIAYKFIFEIIFIVAFISAILIWFTPPRLQSDLEDFNEDKGYGSSVWANKMKFVRSSLDKFKLKVSIRSRS